MDGRADCLVHLRDDVEFTSPDKVFLKGMLMEKSGTVVGQHAHEYGHTSLLVSGRVMVFAEGDKVGLEYKAPSFIWIPPKIKHTFVSMENDTHVYCVHNVQNQKNEYPEVTSENVLIRGR